MTDGLDSKENWIKRKAISLHGMLIDEASERKRFIETMLSADKMETIKESTENIKVLEDEILAFENHDGEIYEWDPQ